MRAPFLVTMLAAGSRSVSDAGSEAARSDDIFSLVVEGYPDGGWGSPGHRDGGSAGAALTHGDIVFVVELHAREIRECIALQRRTMSAQQGELTMHWVIESTGAVKAVRDVTGERRHSVMSTCLAHEIATWRFPAFVGAPLPVDYPFKF